MRESNLAETMCLNNDAVKSFVSGKRHMAAYQLMKAIKKYGLSDGLAYNYAVVNLYTGCPERATTIFSDLVKTYPKNPRLWLRLAESMIASRRAKMNDYEHVSYSTCCCGGANNSLSIGNLQQQTSAGTSYQPGQQGPQRALAFVNHGTTCCYHQASGVACNGLLTRLYTNLLTQHQQLSQKHNKASQPQQGQQQRTHTPVSNLAQVATMPATNQTLSKMRYILIKNGSNIWCPKSDGSHQGGPQSAPTPSLNVSQHDHQQLIDINNKTRSFLTTVKGHLQMALNLLNLKSPEDFYGDLSTSPASSSSSSTTTTNTWVGLTNFNRYLPSTTIASKSEVQKLKNSVYLNLAYICLCMGDPSLARSYTSKCMKENPQGYHKILCNLYHAEACILLDRVDEAIQHLNSDLLALAASLSPDARASMTKGDGDSISGVSGTDAADTELRKGSLTSTNKGQTSTHEWSQVAVYGDDFVHQVENHLPEVVATYNLSVALAIKGEYDKAQRMLTKSISLTQPSTAPLQMTICMLYIQLQQGHFETAKKIIQQNLPQYR